MLRSRRRLLGLALVALLVLATVLVVLSLPRAPEEYVPRTHAGRNWSRVAYGMDRAEAIAILGQPTRTLNAGETGEGLRFDARELLSWPGDNEPLELLVGDKNEVVWKTEFPIRPSLVQEPNLFERIIGYCVTRK